MRSTSRTPTSGAAAGKRDKEPGRQRRPKGTPKEQRRAMRTEVRVRQRY